jgi:hypothetical protein
MYIGHAMSCINVAHKPSITSRCVYRNGIALDIEKIIKC